MDPITLGIALLIADFIIGGPASGAASGAVRGAVRETRKDFGTRRKAIREKRRKELMKTRGGRFLLWLEDAARSVGRGVFAGGGAGAKEGWNATGERMKRRAEKVTKPVKRWAKGGQWDTSDIPDDDAATAPTIAPTGCQWKTNGETCGWPVEAGAPYCQQHLQQPARLKSPSPSPSPSPASGPAPQPARITRPGPAENDDFAAQMRRDDWKALQRAQGGVCIYLVDQGGECRNETAPGFIYCPRHVRHHVQHEGYEQDVTLEGHRAELTAQAEAADRRAGKHLDPRMQADDFPPGTHLFHESRAGADGPLVHVEAFHKQFDGTWVFNESDKEERPATPAEVNAALARWQRRRSHQPPHATGAGSTTNPKEHDVSTETGEATNAVQVLAAWDALSKSAEQFKEQVEADDAAGFGLPSDAEVADAADVLIAAAKAKHDEFDALVEAAEGKQHTQALAYQD